MNLETINRFIDFITSGYKGKCFWELRLISKDGKVDSVFFDDSESIKKFVELNKQNLTNINCYMGINPRIGKERGDENIKSSNILFVDFDNIKAIMDSNKIYQRLSNDCSLKPSLVCNSGHGIHIYWKLESSIDSRKWVELQEALIRFFKGNFKEYNPDDKIKNPERIMRLIGSINVKKEPIETSLLIKDYSTFKLTDIKKILEPYKIEEKIAVPIQFTEDKRIPKNVREMIEKGVGEGERHKTGWIIVKELYKRGYDPLIIEKIYLEFNIKCKPPKDETLIRNHIKNLFENPKEYLSDKVTKEELESIDYGMQLEKEPKEFNPENNNKEVLIHPAGYVDGSMVIEPIGNYEYLWQNNDSRGISKAKPVFKIIVTKKGEKKEGELFYWKISIENKEYKFSDKPLKKLIYSIPARKLIDDWVNLLYDSKTAREIFEKQNKLIRTFLDLPLSHYYNIFNLIPLESWLTEKLNAVFYGCIVGGFGGGKTVALEILQALSRHGQLAGNITSAIARITAQQKLTIFCDELDVKNYDKYSDAKDIKDSELLMNFRQGYRRNNPYIRLNMKTFEAEFFDSFGVKVFSLKSDIEKALKNRSLIINIGETNDNRLPVVNAFKDNFLKPVNDEWFFWYMDNITKVKIPSISFNEIDISKPVNEIREQIWKIATNSLSSDELNFLKKFRGRNIELGFIALIVSKAFDLDILSDIEKSFEEKEEYETDFMESSYQQILKDVLIDLRDKKENYAILKDVYEKFNSIVYEKTKRNISPFKFAELLRDFGFIDNLTKKKIWIDGKSIRCLIFDNQILKRLGIAELSELSELAISKYVGMDVVTDKKDTSSVSMEGMESVASMERGNHDE